jgi:LemA protein
MDFEQETLTRVIEARNQAVSAQQAGPAAAGQSAQAENFLTGALRQLFALVENYPDLKSNQNVMQLQEELTTTENQIGFSRQHYNSTVRDFNTSIQTFPNVLLAGMFGFRERDYFQIEEADAAVPEVNLRTAQAPQAPPAAPASPTPAAPSEPPAAPTEPPQA